MRPILLRARSLTLREDPCCTGVSEEIPARADVRAEATTLPQLSGRTAAIPCGSGDWITSKRRRCLDFMAAAAGLVLTGPLMLLLAILVRVTSGRPILFRQRRMGRHGVEFTLYKFRSMYVDESRGPHITVDGDSRVTPLGAFLRRYKLDELPQLWNVLKGEMSLVGPRPKLPHHEGLELRCRPGITGAATLTFRREEELLAMVPPQELETFYEEVVKPSKAQLDLEYLQKATLGSDLQLLWATGASCLGVAKTEWDEEWSAVYALARARQKRTMRERFPASPR